VGVSPAGDVLVCEAVMEVAYEEGRSNSPCPTDYRIA
jgi:hypothetical protein